jgi:hypothetical protein
MLERNRWWREAQGAGVPDPARFGAVRPQFSLEFWSIEGLQFLIRNAVVCIGVDDERGRGALLQYASWT